MSILDQPWRQGGQVHRTLYVDTGEKDPTSLFGLVDEAEIAAHIVELHNWWLDITKRGEVAWAEMTEQESDQP